MMGSGQNMLLSKLLDNGLVHIADGKHRVLALIEIHGFASIKPINHPSNVDVFLNEDSMFQVVSNTKAAKALMSAKELVSSMEEISGFDWNDAEDLVDAVRKVEKPVLKKLTKTTMYLEQFSNESEWDSGDFVNFTDVFIDEVKFLL